jgi:DNA-binding NarL/FixJ family response regulator
MTDQITVLLVDDQDLIRMGMRLLLDQAQGITVVGEAANGLEAIGEADRLRPDVVIMDVRMPEMNGIDATATITRRLPHTAVLVLTTFDLDEYALSALQAGAGGFLLKDAGAPEIVDAVRTVARGDAIVSARVTRRLLELHRDALPPVSLADTEAAALLTSREMDVLKGVAEGLSNTELAGKLYLAESTIKTHVGRILFKLSLRDRVHAVIYAYEHQIV